MLTNASHSGKRLSKTVFSSTQIHLLSSTARSITSGSLQEHSGASKTEDPRARDTVNQEPTNPKKTMAQLDEELKAILEGRSGDGGAAGIELENGKPVAMKRGVKDNMFRLI